MGLDMTLGKRRDMQALCIYMGLDHFCCQARDFRAVVFVLCCAMLQFLGWFQCPRSCLAFPSDAPHH